jgi:hypothetical protein
MLKYVLADVCSDYCSVSNSIDHGWPRSGPDPQTRDPCHEFRSTEHILLCQVDATASRQAGSEPKKPMLFTAHTAHTTDTHIFIIFSGFKLSKGLSRSQSVDAVSCMALIIFDQGDPGRTQTERNAHAAHAFASSLS